MKIGIVGAGAMALRFLDNVKGQVAGIEFTAVHDVSENQMGHFIKAHPEMKAYGDYNSLLSDPGVEALYISTPVYTHASLVVEAAEYGKHILCEKPMALTLDECEGMVAAAENGGVVLQIGYMMRFHPCHQFIREQIASGVLGKVRFAHVERTDYIDFKSGDIPSHRMWFVDKSKSGGGAFMDLGCHLIDLIIYLLDDDVDSYSFAGAQDPELGVELGGLASLLFHSGSAATVYASWQVAVKDNILQVYGERAGVQAIRTIGPYRDWKVEIVRGDQREVVDIPYRNHYAAELEHFRDCVRDGVEPITSGRICIRTERVRIGLLEQLYKTT